jgi:hypothetical protein
VEGDANHFNPAAKTRLTKLANAAANMVADRDLLRDKNARLFQQNNEKSSRSAAQIIVGRAKIMSYEDIVAALTQREAIESSQKKKGKKRATEQVMDNQADQDDELEDVVMEDYCHVWQS